MVADPSLSEKVLVVLCEDSDSLKYPWELTNAEFRNHFFKDILMKFPVEWLRDPSFLTADAVSVRCRDEAGDTGSRRRDYLDRLRGDIDRDGVKDPVSLLLTRKGEWGICDGTHRVMLADELGLKDVPVEVTPNVVDFGGHALLVRRARLKGYVVPPQVMKEIV